MNENEHIVKLQEKIDSQRVKLNDLILDGLGKDDLLELSRKLDDLINEYYKLILVN